MFGYIKAYWKSLYQDLINHHHLLSNDSVKEAVFLIGEMFLDEQVEAQEDGSYMSHLDLYLELMRDMKCNMGPTMAFFDLIERDIPIRKALRMSGFAKEVIEYAAVMASVLKGKIHEKAAALFYEGEPYIPDRFLVQLDNLAQKLPVERLLDYLERHIEGIKRPGFSASGRVVEILCQDNPDLHAESERLAQIYMHARIKLWDKIQEEITHSNQKAHPMAKCTPPLRLVVNQNAR